MSKQKKKLESPNTPPPENPLFNKSGEKTEFIESSNTTEMPSGPPKENVAQTTEL